MPVRALPRHRAVLLVLPALAMLAVGCGGAAVTGSSGSAASGGSAAPESSGRAAGGDIPDNAVFLTYHGSKPVFSIKYVEGWQVVPQSTGVGIRDKDSSETVAFVAAADPAAYATSTDLAALRAQAGFSLVKQDTIAIGGVSYVHLLFHLPSPPDPVTGKQVSSTVDRYYIPGAGGLAVVSLSSPDGVDNADAFRLMIESFAWS